MHTLLFWFFAIVLNGTSALDFVVAFSGLQDVIRCLLLFTPSVLGQCLVPIKKIF